MTGSMSRGERWMLRAAGCVPIIPLVFVLVVLVPESQGFGS